MRAMSRRVEARAPTRIDLAGGTVDLWPLYLLIDRPLTVNAAIDLEAAAVVERIGPPGLAIVSRDRDARCHLPPGAGLADALGAAPEGLGFILRLTLHFLGGAVPRETPGWAVTTACDAPAGSGLGGSSTLGIALATALDRMTGRGFERDRLLQVTRGVETQVLAIPTGEQDYHPALHGGVLGLEYSVEGTRVGRLAVDTAALRARTVLVYTGVSRNSGISNWDIFKRYLDGEAGVRAALQATSDAAHAMRGALLRGDWTAAATALDGDWQARLRLSPAVTDPIIDGLIAEARSAGALAGKVCGAGGGGCLVLWVPEEARGAVVRRMEARGASVLDVHYVDQGVRVTES
jgi:D-glycero-alpha-D-manno-heptose-7-phosphate kinase